MSDYLYEKYISLRKELIILIQDNEIFDRDDCFLMEKNNFEKLILNKINTYNKNKSNILDDQDEIPLFIENISSALKVLKNNEKLKLIKKDLIVALYQDKGLRSFKCFNYYYGKKKLIIEFNENNSSNALLIWNPLDLNIDNNKYLYVIAFKTFNVNDLKKDLYFNLLNKKIDLNNNILNNLQNNHIVITKFNELYYVDGMYPIEENPKIQRNNFNFVNENILKILIYIFYYEKYLSINKDNSFDENESYLLINPEWLEDYKDFYNYDELCKDLEYISSNNKSIHYKNLNEFILSISNALKNNFVERGAGGINIDYIMPKPSYINNISIYQNCFILDEKIIDMINTHEYLNDIIPKISYKIKVKDKYIYLINSHSISIGNINNDLLFITKCFFVYFNLNILEKEKNLLFSNIIQNYIRLRKCSEVNENIQPLIEGNKNIIGNMIVLNDNEFKTKSIPKKRNNNFLNKDKEISEIKNSQQNYKNIYLKKNITNQSRSIEHPVMNNMKSQEYERLKTIASKDNKTEDFINEQFSRSYSYNKRSISFSCKNIKISQTDYIKNKFKREIKEK